MRTVAPSDALGEARGSGTPVQGDARSPGSDLLPALKSICASLRDVVLVVDRHHRLIWMNEAAERFSGLLAENVAGRHCYEVLRCAGGGCVRACAGLTRGGPSLNRTIAGHDGSTLRVSASRLCFACGERAEKMIACSLVPFKPDADLDRTRTEFLSNVSHELRTPLTSLAASIELLMNYDDGIPADVTAVLQVMHRSTLWLHNLVENLLCASSIQVGRFQVDPQPNSLAELLEEAIGFVVPLLEKKKQTLDYYCPAELVPVMADVQRISQVIINLLHNASKYAPTYDTIGLAVQNLGEVYRITISEHGPGIAPEEREHLFERFYRRRPAEGDGRPGVGLGLAIVRTIIDLHGGKVGVETALGQGSTFWFTLPKASERDLERARGRGLADAGVPGLNIASL